MDSFTKQERGDGFKVSMTVAKQIIHEADLPRPERVQIFGGDEMGHWDVNRAALLAKVMRLPKRDWPLPFDEREKMARVSPLDMVHCAKLAEQEITEPLFLIDMSDGSGADAQMMMIDGHHRMMASVMRKQVLLPVRLFHAELKPLIRVVKIMETTTYMDPPPFREVMAGQYRVSGHE